VRDHVLEAVAVPVPVSDGGHQPRGLTPPEIRVQPVHELHELLAGRHELHPPEQPEVGDALAPVESVEGLVEAGGNAVGAALPDVAQDDEYETVGEREVDDDLGPPGVAAGHGSTRPCCRPW
jgi:hypothetical protein